MSTSHAVRERIARLAFEELGRPGDSGVLMIQCSSAHHLATVHQTPAGRVFHSVVHSRSHGRRDFIDKGHHGSSRGTDWFDLLDIGDPAVGDELPAGCDCGPFTLSRRKLISQIGAGDKKVFVR